MTRTCFLTQFSLSIISLPVHVETQCTANFNFTAIYNHTASMKKLGGERLLIVSPFHRLEAVRVLCGSGSQWRTQALLHEKIQCIKQLGPKAKDERGYKLLFYVVVSLSLCMSYSLSLCHSCLFLTHSPLSLVTLSADNILSYLF